MSLWVSRKLLQGRGAFNLLPRVLLLAAFVALLSPSAIGQTVAVSEVDGYVTDQAGSPVPGATVTMVKTDKHEVHTAATDAQTGRYSFPNLTVGTYDLAVSKAGFKKHVQSGIVLQVANNISINVSLQVGTVEETVEIKADVMGVETKDNSIAEVLDPERIVDLPLNGRNPTQILTLTGAATTMSTYDLNTSKNIGGSNGSGTFSVAGGQGNGLNYLLDGGDNNDPMFSVNLPLPFPDALQEFSVQTTALPAKYGLRAGGVVNAVTQSGTNSYHGDVFEFLRNGIMDAIQDGTSSRDSLKRSQFGGVVGGKIVRDKLFFFMGYQGTRQRSSPASQIAYVPTPAILNGDWSAFETPSSQGGCLSSSTTRQLKNPAGGVFAGNQISTSLYDPAAVKMATKYLPVPNNACGKVLYAFLANNPDDQVIGRVDYNLNSKHSMYARYYIYDYNAQVVFNGSNLLTTGTAGNTERSQAFTFGDTYALSPSMVNSFHGTFNRRRDNRGAPANDISSTDLGINVTTLVPHYNFIAVSGDFQSGCSTCSPGHFNANTFQASDDFNWIRGKHEIEFGGDFRRLQSNLLIDTDANASFTFNGYATGDALADFMLGRIGTLIQDFPQRDELRQTVFSLYAQDTMHLSKRFTANLGLRWEPAQYPYDRQGRDAVFSQAAFNAGTISAKYKNAPAGLIFPGDQGSGPGLSQVHSHWADVSPRVGFIWDPLGNSKQVIRGGFGLMHESIYMFYPERWTYGPPFGSQVNLGTPVGDSFSDPWLNQAGGNPFTSGEGFFPIGGAYYVIPTDFKPMYELQWNLNVQRKVGANWLLQASYIGTKTVHIPTSYDINPSVYVSGSSAATNQRRLLYRQNPTVGKYYGAIYSGDDGGNSKYNAMLLSAQHGFANNFTVTANYTLSHCISDADVQGEVAGTYREDPYNRSFDRGNCSQNVANLFNTSGVAQSPGIGHGMAGILTRNWQLSGLVTWRSGTPLNITDGGVDVSSSGQGNDRPNQIGAAYTSTSKTTKQWFAPGAFQKQAAGTFGNVGRDSLYGPNALNLDAAISRTFHIREHFSYLFRADAFNALNHPVWSNPTTSVTSSNFGKITSFGSPRILQIGSKLIF